MSGIVLGITFTGTFVPKSTFNKSFSLVTILYHFMKKHVCCMLMLCLVSASIVSAQSKKDLEKSLKAEKALSDSLQKDLTATRTILDSLMASYKISSDSLTVKSNTYQHFYTYVYTKYLKPAMPVDSTELTVEQATALLDSLVKARSARMGNLDSAGIKMQSENETLRLKLDILYRAFAEAGGMVRIPTNEADFAGEWDVFVVPVSMTGESPKSGMVSIEHFGAPDSIQTLVLKNIPRSIKFGKDDLAEISFIGGRTTNCFYKIKGFSPDKPYIIDLNRGEDLDLRIHVVHTLHGIQASVELPALGNDATKRYLFGYMKR